MNYIIKILIRYVVTNDIKIPSGIANINLIIFMKINKNWYYQAFENKMCLFQNQFHLFFLLYFEKFLSKEGDMELELWLK